MAHPRASIGKPAPGPVAGTPIDPPPLQPVPLLTNSTRSLRKATLVPLKVSNPPAEGAAILKFGLLRRLTLQPGEVAAVKAAWAASALAASPTATHDGPLWDLLTAFENTAVPALLPPSGAFASVPAATLARFGSTLTELRKMALNDATQRHASLPHSSPEALGKAQHLAAVAATSTRGFAASAADSRIGMVNLERLDMTPAGIERGALIATIPLAPGEKTAVVQKEWSVTSKEFTSIVTDTLENISETGVTDNTELSQASSSQSQHANQFNITGTVSGNFDIVTGSVTSSFGVQDSQSQAANDSRKHASAVTQKASSRSTREHKVTISTTTVTGSAETTTRELVNTTANPVRIDYFSLMRKWRVRLVRYGLRSTYDIVIPEPGAALRKVYAELDTKRKQLGPFTFNIPHSQVTLSNLTQVQKWADALGAELPDVPENGPTHVSKSLADDTTAGFVQLEDVEIDVPAGFWIRTLLVSMRLENTGGGNGGKITVLFSGFPEQNSGTPNVGPVDLTLTIAKFMLHAEGKCVIKLSHHDLQHSAVEFIAYYDPTDATASAWQNNAWNALYQAAQTQYYAQQQDIADRIKQLEDQLASVDTLTLRREESDEIMKGVIHYLFGEGFESVPNTVAFFLSQFGADVSHGVGYTGDGSSATPWDWSIAQQYESQVRFINQAIEWENVVTFLYSYFWDLPPAWDFVRQIRHPDANRQAFLRAGSARVVLTLRKGWEKAWIQFAEGGFQGQPVPDDHPYLTIAQEISAYDDRNYPGIPPANSGATGPRLEDTIFTQSTTPISPAPGVPLANVEVEVKASYGFYVNDTVVVDSGVSDNPNNTIGRQESCKVVAVRDAVHLTLDLVTYSHGGDDQAYVIFKPGEKGQAIAEWYEYTPSSGTDIAVSSNLITIA